MTDLAVSTADLLTPTKIYVREVLSIIEQVNVTGIAHITGGGLVENVSEFYLQVVGLMLILVPLMFRQSLKKFKPLEIFQWLKCNVFLTWVLAW